MKEKILLGAHFSYTKNEQLLKTINEAISTGANSGSFYISPSRSYQKWEQDLKIIKEAKELAESNGFSLDNFVVHSPLVGNIANIDIESGIFEKTLNSYLEDIKMLEAAGIKYYNFHPGSCPDRKKGIKQIAKAINILHNKTKGHQTILLLETMMFKGNYIGGKFEDLKEIIELVKDKSRVGVCIDTCHIWDAGYDIKNNLNKVIKNFDEIIGIDYLKALHINDSKNELGSNKDRHENIGKGFIGLEALRKIVKHPKLKHLPKSLETPYSEDDIGRWKKEIKLLID